MSQFILFADIAGDLAQTAKETAEKFGFDWAHFGAQVINFLILAGVLTVFAYKPILKVLEERKQRIADSLANAEKIKVELARTEAARQEVLNQANLQANKLIEEARAAAARVQEQETRKAIAAAEQVVARAREAAAQDHARMVAELKREVGRVVVETAGKGNGRDVTIEVERLLHA